MDGFSRVGDSGDGGSQAGSRRYVAGDLIREKYRLTSLLGEGGMGAVWAARNVVLDNEVAIKLIRHGIASAEASERLQHEARAAARLEHPGILRVFDFGTTDDGDPFIVMELLRGESLAHILDRRGRLSASEAVRTLLPVLSAVAAAHAKGIVHRDLKPDNVLLTENDSGAPVPKVVDFGIAKMRVEGMAQRGLTQAGAILGTPDYMCPEQARGRADINEKCDVWACGVILYECLAGQRPFNADNYNALLTSIIEDAPTPTTEFAAGDDVLWEIVCQCLSKEPELRPTTRELGVQLAQWAIDGGDDTDVSGVSLTNWLEAPARRPISEGPAPARVGAATPRSSRRAAPTQSERPDEAGPPPPTRSSVTPLAGASTRPGTTTVAPPAAPRRGVAAATAVAVVAVAALGWSSLRGWSHPAREGDVATVAAGAPAAMGAPPATGSDALARPTPVVSPVASILPSSDPTSPTSASAPTASASARPVAAPGRTSSPRRNGPRPPSAGSTPKEAPGLSIPAQPNF